MSTPIRRVRARVRTPVVPATKVSRMYRKKVYERRGGV